MQSDVKPAATGSRSRLRRPEAELRRDVISALRAQGFRVVANELRLPDSLTKEMIRDLHSAAVAHRRERSADGLRKHERRLLQRLASASEVRPAEIAPVLVEVVSGSEDELMFRYAALHWSVPVSSGYGRRIRFLVIDQSNDKLIGLIGLGDPVFSLSGRDHWVGWKRDQRLVREDLQAVLGVGGNHGRGSLDRIRPLFFAHHCITTTSGSVGS